jgi:hypothetical protein
LNRDPLNWPDVPADIEQRLADLRQRADDAHAQLLPLLDAQQEARQRRGFAATRLKSLKDGQRFAWKEAPDAGGWEPSTDPGIKEQERIIAQATREIERLERLIDERSTAHQEARGIAGSVSAYLLQLGAPSAWFRLDAAIEVAPRKNESLADAVESRRRRRRELQNDRQKVITAPYPSSLLKEKARAEIDALAERGRPQVSLYGHRIEWPSVPVHVRWTDGGGTGGTADAVGIAVWANRHAITEAIEREIDEIADDAAALTDAQRSKALSDIDRDTLHAEREEEGFIRLSEQAGTPIARRGNHDPRAVLDLCGTLPAKDII